MAEIKIRLPDPIRRGDVVEVMTLALAPPLPNADAEFDADGIPIPHYVGFDAELDGRPLMRARFGPGISRNVMFSFSIKVERAGALTLRWTLRDGGFETRQVAIAPSG